MDQHATAGDAARVFPSNTATEGPSAPRCAAPWRSHVRRVDGQPWARVPPPPYQRKRHPQLAGRDRWWRRDAHIAIDGALRAGELALHEAAVLRSVLAHSDDRGAVVWASQQTLAKAAGWGSDRTARRWLRAAEAKGWVAVEHRCDRRPDGTLRALTNITVVVLPPDVDARRVARKQGSKGHATPRTPHDRPSDPSDPRPRPPVLTPADYGTVVLCDLPEPATTGPGATYAARALRRARGSP